MTVSYMRQLRQYLRFYIVAIGCMALTGCFGPLHTQAKQQAALAKNETKTQTAKDQLTAQASAQVYAVNFALSRAQPPAQLDPAITLAKTFASRAQITLGQPAYEDALFYEGVITGLQSTNAAVKAKAQRDLDDKDADIAAMEDLVSELQEDNKTLQTKMEQAYQKAAREAQWWVSIKRWALWIGGGIGVILLLALLAPILALAFPALGPVAGLFVSLVGGAVKRVIAVIPQAAEKAGVVAKSTYDLAQCTLEQVVVAVQEAKKASPEAAAALKPALLAHTDEETRPVIAAIKEDYRLI